MNLSPDYVIVSGDKSTLIMRPVFGEYYKEILAITVCSNHVHVVVNCIDEPLEVAVARYKKAGRVALRETGFEGRVWTRGYDKRFCFDGASLEERIRYVQGHDS